MPIIHLLAASSAATSKKSSAIGDSDWENLDSDEDRQKSKKIVYPVLIDTDGGTEDAWALLMALRAHKDPKIPLDIIGITCVHGATSADNVTKNVRRILQTAGVNDIPIYRGAETAMVKSFETKEDPPYNGHDGFGDANLPNLDARAEAAHAVNGIVEAVNRHMGNLRILALGPLTNLALALRMQPEMKDHLRSLFILGGNMEGVGNATPAAEFNFASDPEAAHVVLSTVTCPLYILPWEASLRTGVSAHPWRVNSLGHLGTNEIAFMNQIEAKILKRYTEAWIATDALCAAAFIEPRVILKKKKFHCRIELQGSETRGMLVLDHNFRHQKPPNAVLLTEVNLLLYQKMLIWAAGGEYYKNKKVHN